jgi:hypothetical protein
MQIDWLTGRLVGLVGWTSQPTQGKEQGALASSRVWVAGWWAWLLSMRGLPMLVVNKVRHGKRQACMNASQFALCPTQVVSRCTAVRTVLSTVHSSCVEGGHVVIVFDCFFFWRFFRFERVRAINGSFIYLRERVPLQTASRSFRFYSNSLRVTRTAAMMMWKRDHSLHVFGLGART